MADMLILFGVSFNNLQGRKQHVHELTLPCVWGAGLTKNQSPLYGLPTPT